MMLNNIYELFIYDLDELNFDLFENDDNFLLKKERIYNSELIKIVEIYHQVWKENIKEFVLAFKNKSFKKYKSFYQFVVHYFNETLKNINSSLQDKKLNSDWVSLFTHWTQEKIIMSSGIIEKISDNKMLFKKQKMIQILNFYKMLINFIDDDIKYLHKEKIEEIIQKEKDIFYK